MRRLLAISLLLLFSLPLITPAFALSANTDAGVPACCRRTGAHQCFMKIHRQRTPTSGTTFNTLQTTCPAYPNPTPVFQRNDIQPQVATLIQAAPTTAEAITSHTHPLSATSLDTACQKRGPPSLNS